MAAHLEEGIGEARSRRAEDEGQRAESRADHPDKHCQEKRLLPAEAMAGARVQRAGADSQGPVDHRAEALPLPAKNDAPAAERRVITVFFSDIAGGAGTTSTSAAT